MEQLTQLARTGRLAQMVLEALPGTGVLVFDRDLRYLLAAGDAFVRHGYDPPSLVGRSLDEVFPGQLHDTLLPMYRAALDGTPIHLLYTVFDGSRDYMLDATPLRMPSGSVIGGVIFSRDVTEITRR